MNKKIIIGIVLLLLIVAIISIMLTKNEITTFEECVEAGYPVMETYPEQCMIKDGQIFTNPNQEPLDNSIAVNSEEISACQTSGDCVPMPGCHPTECINKEYESLFTKPEFCTLEYRYDAAYSPEDCSCDNNVCINLNRRMEELNEIDQNQSNEVDSQNCSDVCSLVWEMREDGCFFNECDSSCGADYVTTFNSEEECLLALEYS